MNRRNLRTQQRNESRRTGRSFFRGAAMLMGLLLLTIGSFAQYVAVTHTSGTVAYGGVNVTVVQSGLSTLASTCNPTLHYQNLDNTASWSFTFATPITSVRIPHLNSGGGSLTTTHFIVNGVPYTLTPANITGDDFICFDPTLNDIVGGDITNTSDVFGFPSLQVDIPGPITTLVVQQTTGTNVGAFQVLFQPCSPSSPHPVAVAMTGGGGYCAGGAGVNVGLAGSVIGTNYQLYRSGSPVGSPVAGVGMALSFGLQTTAGVYTAVATNGLGCSTNMTGSSTVAVYPVPNIYTVTGGGVYCAGGTGIPVGVSGSDAGVNYKLYRGGTPTGTMIAGTGGPISFGPQTVAGTYTVVAQMSGFTACTSVMTGSTTVSTSALPTVYTVTGGGSLCSGGTGVHVGLSSSSVGVNYQLYVGGSATGSPVAGTGAALDFGAQTVAGTYTVVATDATTGCTKLMTSSVVISTAGLPLVFAVTGGGTYCTGGAGVNVGLSGSTAAISYQLYLAGSPVGSPVFGTGSAITFGLKTATGVYTVVATNLTTGCTNTMAGSVSVATVSLPPAYTVTGGGTYCLGGPGLHVYLASSDLGVNYQLYRSGTAVGSAVPGTGSLIDFGLLTTGGTYTVTGTASGSTCSTTMTGSVTIGTLLLPTAYAITGGGGYCSGGTGVAIGLGGSQTGVSYQLYVGGSPTGSPVSGTGLSISFGLQTTVGTYTVVATNTSTGCSNNMTGVATIFLTAPPTAFTVTGGGSYCAGGSGVSVGLSGSQSGISYQLYLSGSPVGSPMTGTGSAFSFGLKTAAGVYTVAAVSGCTNTMTGSVTIAVNPLPTAYTVTGGGGLCAGSTASVMLSGSDAGVNYQLYRSGAAMGSAVAGTGATLTFGPFTVTGTYTVIATDATTGCTRSMTGSASIFTASPPAIVSMTGGGGYCSGGAGVHVGLNASAVGVNYQLYRAGSPVGTPVAGVGGTLDFGLQTVAGTYTATASNGCTSTMAGTATVSVLATPTMFTVTGGGGYCAGTSGVHVGLSGSTSGTSYRLYLSGTPVGSAMGGTGSPLDFGLVTGTGTYTIIATAGTGCTASMSGSVTVAVNPNPVIGGGLYTVAPGASITLTATIGGGTWSTNTTSYATINPGTGVVTGVALGTTVVTYTLTTGCYGIHTVATTATGFRQSNSGVTATESNGLSAMPNPNHGTFVVNGTLATQDDQEATIEITNMVGQVVYSSKVTVLKGAINETIQLGSNVANGVYLLSVHTANENNVTRIVVQK